MTRAPIGAMVPFIGLGAFIVTSIFYVLPSGSPQPADVLILTTIVVTFLVGWRYVPNETLLYAILATFCVWAMLVNTVWFFVLPDPTFLRKTSFYVFNAVIFVFVIAAGYHDWERLKIAVRWSCVIALLIQLVYLVFISKGGQVGSNSLRSVGTFNNPNQLGYWALLLMACLAVVKERVPLTVVDIAALGAGFYALMLSLSKAASISGMVLILLIIAFCRLRRAPTLALLAVIVVGLTFQFAFGGPIERFMSFEPVAKLEARLSAIGAQPDDNASSRGYLRLLYFPEYLAFGAGEGGFYRFTLKPKWDHTSEFHSTLGTILMSYGIVGFGLFIAWIVVVFARAPLANVAYLFPIMLYGLTHTGLRFSEFWIFFALVYTQSRYGTYGRVRCHT